MFTNTSIYEQLTALPYLPAYKRLIEGAIELHNWRSQSPLPNWHSAWAGMKATRCIFCRGFTASVMWEEPAIPFKTRRTHQNIW